MLSDGAALGHDLMVCLVVETMSLASHVGTLPIVLYPSIHSHVPWSGPATLQEDEFKSVSWTKTMALLLLT